MKRTSEERARHWDNAYASRGARGVSWYQDTPRMSLELFDALGVGRHASVIDIGGGASVLADQLVARGFIDLSVLDISAAALAEARRRLGDPSPVTLLHEDLLVWRPVRRFKLWHDRAVFHFLVASDDRDRYLRSLRAAIDVDGYVVIATFAADGPEHCSGLPVARYSATDLAELLGPGFELREMRRETHITPGGVAQPFTWVAGRFRQV